jgi:hypothetical protein
MDHEPSATRAEKRERKNRSKMAVSGRNLKRLAGHIAQRNRIDRQKAS